MPNQFSDNNPPRTLRLETVLFRRGPTSEHELGVLINKGEGILDLDGKIVEICWTYDEVGCHTMTVREDDIDTDAAGKRPGKAAGKRAPAGASGPLKRVDRRLKGKAR